MMLALLVVLLLEGATGSGGTGGHAYITGFFTGENTVHVDHQLQQGAPHALRIKLSGVAWSARCCETPGLLATALLSSNRPAELPGFEQAFMAQLRTLPAVQIAEHTVEIKLTPMPQYALPSGAEIISVATRIPAQFLESELDAGVVNTAAIPQAMVISRAVSIQGLLFTPRKASPLPVELHIRRAPHSIRLAARADSWVNDVTSARHRPLLLLSLAGICTPVLESAAKCKTASSDESCFANWARSTIDSWNVTRVSDHRLEVHLPQAIDYNCRDAHTLPIPRRISGELLQSGLTLERIEGGIVEATIMPGHLDWDEKSEL